MIQPARKALVIGIGSFGFGNASENDDEPEYDDLEFVAHRTDGLSAALAELGYSCTVPSAAELCSDTLGSAIQTAVDAATAADAVVIHVLSHGCLGERTDSLYVVGADGRSGPRTRVDEWLSYAADFAGPHVLFLLDLCHAGAAARLPWQLKTADSDNRAWVIGAASEHQEAFNGRFTEAVGDVFRALANGDMDIDSTLKYVPLPTVARAIDRRVTALRDRDSAFHQEVTCTAIDIKYVRDLELPFFPNVHYEDSLVQNVRRSVDPAIHTFIDELDEAVDAEHFITRASGHGPFTETASVGMFHGRAAQLRGLADWMDDPGSSGLRLVTGSPGVGKSALLGVLLCAAHPKLNQPTRHLWCRAAHAPSVQEHMAAVHLRQRHLDDVLHSLAQQLSLSPPATGHWTSSDLIRSLRRCPEPPVILLDALDEATQPSAIQTILLIPLLNALREDGRNVARVLVGVRPWDEFAPLRELAAAHDGIVDLDDVSRDELREDLSRYADGVLRGHPGYRVAARRAVREQIADALATKLINTEPDDPNPKCGEFLVAGLYLHHVVNALAVATDVTEAEAIGTSVPVSLSGIMELDLRSRQIDTPLRAVLAALAHARGDGMPASLIASAARAFDAPVLQTAAAREAIAAGRFYLRHAVDSDGAPLYRLFHQGLADYLRVHPTARETQSTLATNRTKALFDMLHATTQASNGLPLWRSAEPYLLRHIASHAAEAGCIDELLADAEFIVHADPVLLLRELDGARAEDAQLAAAVYRSSAENHQNVTPEARREMLMVDAARFGAWPLAHALGHPPGEQPADLRPRWCTGSQASPSLLATLSGHRDPVSAAACTTLNGRPIVITGSVDRTLQIWDLATGHPIGTPMAGHTGPITAIVCTTLNGRPVAVSSSKDCSLRTWDIATGREAREPIVGHIESIFSVACAEVNGQPVAVSCGQDAIHAWDLTSGTLLWGPVYPGGWTHTVICIKHQDHAVAITGGDDNTINQWSLTTGVPETDPLVTGEPRQRRGLHRSVENAVISVRYFTMNESRFIVAGKGDGTLRAWNLDTGEPASEEVQAHQEVLCDITLGRVGGQLVAVTGGDDGARVWELPDLRPYGLPLTGHDEWVWSVALTEQRDRPVLITGSGDRQVRIWDLNVDRQLGHPEIGHGAFIQAVDVTWANGRQVAVSGGNDRTVRVWELDTGEQIGRPFAGHAGRIYDLTTATMGDQTVVATAGEDGTTRIWDIFSGNSLAVLEANANKILTTVSCIDINGRLVTVAAGYSGIFAWDTASSERILENMTDARNSSAVALACTYLSGQPVLVTGDTYGLIQAWDLTNGEPISQLGRMEAEVRAVECTELNGRTIAVTGDRFGNVMMWDLATWNQLGETRTDDSRWLADVTCTDFAGQLTIVTAGWRTISFWHPDSSVAYRTFSLPRHASSIKVTDSGDVIVGLGWETLVFSCTAWLRPQPEEIGND